MAKKIYVDPDGLNEYHQKSTEEVDKKLNGDFVENNEFTFRATDGITSIKTGTAYLERIKGNTVKWNQLIQNGYEVNFQRTNTGQSTYYGEVNSNALALQNPQIGHICYVKKKIVFTSEDTCNFYFISHQPWGNGFFSGIADSAIITEMSGISDKLRYMLPSGASVAGTISLIYIDLTLIYGKGNEPSTIAQFESDYYKWFGKPLTSECYTDGELRDVKMSGIKTVGFNAFNLSTGKAKLLGGQEYEVVGTYTGLTIDGESVTLVDGKFTPAQSCELVVTGGDSTTCVHLVHSGKRNGESESYWEETKNVPVTTLTGKLNGEGESVIVFPDGMKSVGAVQDDILIENGGTNGIKRIGSNDLGGYNYTKQGNLYTTNFVPANANMISGRGKAVVWNQKVKNGSNKQASGLTTTYLGDLTYKINGTNTALTVQNLFAGDAYIIGHKYFQSVIAISGEVSDSVIFYNGWGARTNLGEENITQQTSAQATNGIIGLQCTVGTTFSDLVVRIQRFDLTQMFGEGNEPTTVEEFRAMFPEDYYEYNTGSLGIVADATYADAASFKASMAGVSLYYELETPLVYELDNFQLPLPYRVDDYGTEEIKGAENSVAPTLDIRYGINIIDTIRNLPKTIDSIEEEISDTNDRIDDAFDDIDTKEDKSTFSHSTSEVPPSTALTFTPNVNTIYYQHESTPVIGNINMVLPIPETERATIKVIYRNSTSDAPTITSEEGVNVIIENNIGGPYRLTTINCEWYHDCWVVDIQTHGT